MVGARHSDSDSPGGWCGLGGCGRWGRAGESGSPTHPLPGPAPEVLPALPCPSPGPPAPAPLSPHLQRPDGPRLGRVVGRDAALVVAQPGISACGLRGAVSSSSPGPVPLSVGQGDPVQALLHACPPLQAQPNTPDTPTPAASPPPDPHPDSNQPLTHGEQVPDRIRRVLLRRQNQRGDPQAGPAVDQLRNTLQAGTRSGGKWRAGSRKSRVPQRRNGEAGWVCGSIKLHVWFVRRSREAVRLMGRMGGMAAVHGGGLPNTAHLDMADGRCYVQRLSLVSGCLSCLES